MTTSNHFIELWQKLETTNHHGIVKIAYSEDSRYRIYATMSCPDHICGFAISFDNSIKVELKPFRDLRQLSVELLTDTSYDNSSLLLVQLRNVDKRDVFAILCENLVSSANQVNEERLMLKIVISKLFEWKSLFDKLSNGPLSKPQQQGLFGELYFIKNLLNNKKEAIEYNVISTWRGMEEERAIRDFQGQDWVVEVKTTSTNSPQKVTINGERQLDDSLVDNLLLYHCSVDISNASGITLQELVEEIRSILSHSFVARALFEEKLYHTGYQDKDIEFYNDIHYLIRTDKFYKVADNFPRICEKDLRPGVGEVHYSIVLAACEQYLVSNTFAYSIINII